MEDRYDLVVIGLGVSGAAATWRAAATGARVLGLDRYDPPHSHGSSHGSSRIIRNAYFEGSVYVPLVRRALEGWLELERVTGRPLLRSSRALMIGPMEDYVVRGSIKSAREYRIPHRLLTSSEIRERFPLFHPPAGVQGLLEELAAILDAEASVDALLHAAVGAGAELRTGNGVLDWEENGDGIAVHTAHGTIQADAGILAAGAWLEDLLPEGAFPAGTLMVERQPVHWLTMPHGLPQHAGGERHLPSNHPISAWELGDQRFFYTVPEFGNELKVGIFQKERLTHPDRADREVSPAEVAEIRQLIGRFLPDLADAPLRSKVCLSTKTPDLHFIVGKLGPNSRMVIFSACSGHGFKFAPALGEAAAELALTDDSHLDISLFSPTRFTSADD